MWTRQRPGRWRRRVRAAVTASLLALSCAPASADADKALRLGKDFAVRQCFELRSIAERGFSRQPDVPPREIVEAVRRICTTRTTDDGFGATLRLTGLNDRLGTDRLPDDGAAYMLNHTWLMMLQVGADLRPLRYTLINAWEDIEPATPGMYPSPYRGARQYLARELELWTHIHRLSLVPGADLEFDTAAPGPFGLPQRRPFRARGRLTAAGEGIFVLEIEQVLGAPGAEGPKQVITFTYRIDAALGYATDVSYHVRYGAQDLERIEIAVSEIPWPFED